MLDTIPSHEQQVMRRRGGWRIVARKELGDYLTSARFGILIAMLGVVAAGAVYAASSGIRSVAPQAQEVPALFLKLFTITSTPMPFPFVVFVAFFAPLLGIMFGFDAIGSERSQGTLARVLSHPIHRDEVIIGKFVAGLSVIALMLGSLVLLVSGIGIFRVGVVPSFDEVIRLALWTATAVAYSGTWLAFALLMGILVKKTATAALATSSVWLLLTVFGQFLFGGMSRFFANPSDPGSALKAEVMISRFSPLTLFQDASTVLLDPTQRAVGLVTTSSVDRAILSKLSIGQSMSVVWAEVVALIAMIGIAFALSFIYFMRQEVRA